MRFTKLVLPALLLLAFSGPVHTQGDWKKIAPFGESFTVSMPTAARMFVRMVPLSETQRVPARVLYSMANGRRYGVAMFRRTTPVTDREVRNNPLPPPGAPHRNPPLTNFAEFVTAMEWSLAKGEESGTLTLDKDFANNGGAVKQYELQIRETKGVVRLMEAGNSMYAQFVVGAEKMDPDSRRFLDSFAVGETNDNEEPNVTNVIAISEGESARQELPPEPWPRPFNPIMGGVLNGKALTLGRPEYPSAARANYDQGQVRVQILIDEFGRVLKAEAISGPTTLREAAVRAAFKSRFTPTRLMGQPVKVSGVIVYNFIAQ